MITREAIVAAARTFIGTPYLHQGRVRGPQGGIDCVGLGVCSAWEVGSKPRSWNITGYRRLPDGVSLMHHLGVHMGAASIDVTALQPADLIVLSWGRFPHHVGIIGDYVHGGLSLIHANNVTRRVEEQRLVLQDDAKFVAAFQFPGVT